MYLARQSMHFCGHNETETSNIKGKYLELFDLFSKYDRMLSKKNILLHYYSGLIRLCYQFRI